jgi:hypothetical protein
MYGIRHYLVTVLLITEVFNTFGQTPNVFANYKEYKENTPSLTFNFKLKQRSKGDVFMTGGITNCQVKEIQLDSNKKFLEEDAWGVKINDTVYINSYPYSKMPGYNKIIEKGYYTYFIGEPAYGIKEQKELGFIEPDAKKRIQPWGRVGYVILLDGTIKLLKPDVVLELCKDYESLVAQIKAADLQQENVHQMFKCLALYNEWKK